MITDTVAAPDVLTACVTPGIILFFPDRTFMSESSSPLVFIGKLARYL